MHINHRHYTYAPRLSYCDACIDVSQEIIFGAMVADTQSTSLWSVVLESQK